VKRARQKKSIPSPAVKPITWHQGWQEIGSPAGIDPTETGEHATEAGKRPSDLSGDNQPGFGVQHRVELSTEPTKQRDDGGKEPQYLTAFLDRPDGDETAPRVFIGHNEGSALAATLDEARVFALEILALVEGHES
jgi:hypothetical protein